MESPSRMPTFTPHPLHVRHARMRFENGLRPLLPSVKRPYAGQDRGVTGILTGAFDRGLTAPWQGLFRELVTW
jgi:hypothetical protein